MKEIDLKNTLKHGKTKQILQSKIITSKRGMIPKTQFGLFKY